MWAFFVTASQAFFGIMIFQTAHHITAFVAAAFYIVMLTVPQAIPAAIARRKHGSSNVNDHMTLLF